MRVSLLNLLSLRIAMFIGVVRFSIRQLEDFAIALHRLIPKLPSIDYSWRRILKLNLSPYEVLEGPVVIAIDASGVCIHKSAGWVEQGKKRHYIKIHFAVEVKTKEVYGGYYRES